jgi:hypothetical protein
MPAGLMPDFSGHSAKRPMSPPDRITPNDVYGRKTEGAMHIDMSNGSMWIYAIEGIPRLGIIDKTERGKGRTRTFGVDGKACRDLDDALAVINGEMSLEDAVERAKPQPTPQPKFSLEAQISEVDRELAMREKVYPGWVKSRKMREQEAEYHLNRMRAVKATLEWLRDREDLLKQRLSY